MGCFTTTWRASAVAPPSPVWSDRVRTVIPAAASAWLSWSAPPGERTVCPAGWTPSGPMVTAWSPTLAPSMTSSPFVSGFAAPLV